LTDDRSNDRADADFGSPASDSPSRGGLKALAARTAKRDAGDDHDGAFRGDEAANDRRFALVPVDAIARTALGAATPADVRARLAADAPIAIVVSVPGPDWVGDIRMALATITATARDLRLPAPRLTRAASALIMSCPGPSSATTPCGTRRRLCRRRTRRSATASPPCAI
jgi:hypothetical protein